MYDAANRNQLAASTASAHLQQQASAQSAANQARASEHSAAMQAQQEQFAASREVSPRDQFAAAQHQQDQQQRFQQQQWLMQQDLSQREQMQLQEATGGLATVLSDPDVSEQEKQTAMQLYQQRINPLRVRQQQMQMKVQKVQAEAAVHQGTLEGIMQNGNEAQRSAAFSKRVVTATDDQGQPVLDDAGRPIRGWLDHRGDFKPFVEKGSGEDKQVAAEYKEARKEFWSQYEATEKQVDARIQHGIAKDANGNETIRPGFPTVENRSEAIVDSLRGRGLPTNLAEFDAQWAAGRHGHQRFSGQQQPPAQVPLNGQPQQGQGPQPIRPIPGATPPPQAQQKLQDVEGAEKPFSLNDHSTMAPGQSLAMKNLGDFRAKVGSPEVLQAVDLVANFYANFGTLDDEKLKKRGATPEQRAALNRADELIRRAQAAMKPPDRLNDQQTPLAYPM